MLRRAKLAVCRAAHKTGINKLFLDSGWRTRRLLILCYHGVSLEDEHEWNSHLYMHPDLFRRRMRTLADLACNVLPFGDALDRLRTGTLPPRSVAITFDDGSYDFYRVAWPILREFRYPATLYFTTYYSDFNRPVFDVMCSYLLWKGRDRRLDWAAVLQSGEQLDDEGRSRAERQIKSYAMRQQLSGSQKDELLAALAGRLGLDYEALCRRRLLHLITRGEARELAHAGVDIQLHTHRHRESRDRDRMLRELDDNRERIMAVTPVTPLHFCYTGGLHLPEFPSWLREYGLHSATTCEPGLARADSDPMLLPRLVDTTGLTDAEFVSWISGFAQWLPARAYVSAEGQLMEEPVSDGSPNAG
jgi:peptidoglycan/xylan/chitin deacetylase (PgdA/CDA1 family)